MKIGAFIAYIIDLVSFLANSVRENIGHISSFCITRYIPVQRTGPEFLLPPIETDLIFFIK